MKQKARIMDKVALQKTLKRLALQIVEKNKGTRDLALIGIMNRGIYLARRIAKLIAEREGFEPPVGAIDITLYRDDLSMIAEQPVVGRTEINFDITSKKVILVDDVLYTGRTIRSALTELIDFGRPQFIQLAVLIDRGFRELPIRADFVGKNIPTSKKEAIEVRLTESDGVDEVAIMEKDNG